MPTAIEVLFPLPLPPFRYLVPFGERPGPLGGRVVVPWQSGVRIGLVVGVDEVSAGRSLELREAIGWLDQEPFLPEIHTAFLLEIAGYYATPAGLVLAAMVPTGFKEKLVHEIQAVKRAAIDDLPEDLWVEAARLPVEKLELYRSQGLVLERVRVQERQRRVLRAVRPVDRNLAGRAQANQRCALEMLLTYEWFGSAAELSREAGVPESSVRALVRKGYARYEEVPSPPPALPQVLPSEEGFEAAKEPLDLSIRSSLTGGNRRERLGALVPNLVRETEAGRGCLVLVPEHALLEETASLLAAVLPVEVVSGELSDDQRARLWRELPLGPPVVLVGTYLALFAPQRPLGLLVVLEAGNASYKLASGPRMFVPTVAARFAERLDIPLVFTSALFSPEMSQLVSLEGRKHLAYKRLRYHVSDMSSTRSWPLSTDLVKVLKQVGERKRQAVMLTPRRGFSGGLGCRACGWLGSCPNCDLPLRYHRRDAILRCHQCGASRRPPDECPKCGQVTLVPFRGAGTEWFFSAVKKILPDVPVFRLDRDHQDPLEELHQGEPGILVATTAAFRRAPLPDVGLIVVCLLDTHLNVPDFRAEEETLRLLLELPELVKDRLPLTLLQTFSPSHPVCEVVRAKDLDAAVDAFVERMCARRKAFGYPPFSHLAKVQFSARVSASALQAAERFVASLEIRGARAEEVIGPTPAPVGRIKGFYAQQVFLKAAEVERFRWLLEGVKDAGSGVRVRIDVDPREVNEFLD
ncbi:MAG: primosomal protein N' [Trueperaceae bacterium]|nr:MAG: primosomal protein N' [Trueperaceae bacterium]